jgi:hypothetical protein
LPMAAAPWAKKYSMVCSSEFGVFMDESIVAVKVWWKPQRGWSSFVRYPCPRIRTWGTQVLWLGVFGGEGVGYPAFEGVEVAVLLPFGFGDGLQLRTGDAGEFEVEGGDSAF